MASSGMQYGMMGLTTLSQTAGNVQSSVYNAASLRMQAKAIKDQSNLQAYLIRQQYANEYEELKAQQEYQQSANRVAQMKHGITGASANTVMQAYAAKGQANLNRLYYNAAMATGQQSLQASSQRQALLEKARQYDWKATQSAVAGVIQLGSGAITQYTKDMGNTGSAYANLEAGAADKLTVEAALTELGHQWEIGSPEYERAHGISLGYTE